LAIWWQDRKAKFVGIAVRAEKERRGIGYLRCATASASDGAPLMQNLCEILETFAKTGGFASEKNVVVKARVRKSPGKRWF
jgi:hypothetical protein